MDGQFSLVANVRHLSTGYISHQFHFVFDDLFDTFIHKKDNDSTIEMICSDLFNINRYCYAEE